MNIHIRRATADDAPALLAHAESILAEEIYSLSVPGELMFTIAQEQEWIKSKNENPQHLLLIAEVSNQIVGVLDLSNGHRQRIAHTAEFGMSIARPFRNQGIGRRLLEEMLKWARDNPVLEKISLKVHADNDRAIHLYKSLGFIQEGYLTKELKYGPNQYVDSILLSVWV